MAKLYQGWIEKPTAVEKLFISGGRVGILDIGATPHSVEISRNGFTHWTWLDMPSAMCGIICESILRRNFRVVGKDGHNHI